ncbi:MAG: efflux RND transporter permease subunit [Deltaproteobacteria bacterium]|nr:efflux RND transporter permease subunit [Deltaproteobacteria bacterium]
MIEGLVKQSLRTRLLIFILATFLAAAGWYAYRNLTIEAFPDPTDTQVQVITLYNGQPSEEVERRVSIPLERALNGVPGLYRLRSISLFGLSLVTLTFQDGVDPLVARQQIMERIPGAELPPGIDPELGPLATPIGEIYRYTLEGRGADPMSLRTIQDWIVRPALMRVQGVADVVTYGGLVREVHVEPNPAQMASLGVTLDALFQALSKASQNASGGALERGEQLFVIRSLGTFQSLDDIRKVRAGFHAGRAVSVGDVATVTIGYQPRQGVVSREGNYDTVEGIVLMRRGENPSVVLDALRERIDELHERALPNGKVGWAFQQKQTEVLVQLQSTDETGGQLTRDVGLYPAPCAAVDPPPPGTTIAARCGTTELRVVPRDDGVEIVEQAAGKPPATIGEPIRVPIVRIHPFYDRGDLVGTTLDTVFRNLGEGALLVSIVLFAFLLSVRASLVVALVIPLSLAASFIYLRARGMSANLLSMGAVDFGIIVDGAVILVEHVFGHCAGDEYQRKSPAERVDSIYQAAREVARPTLFSLLIIVAAYLPIFALERVEGRIFAPMAHTVVSALIGAMIVSFTLVPALAFFALRRHKKVRESPILKVARRAYDPVLTNAMRNPFAVLLASAGLMWSGVELAPRLGTEFLPELNEGSLYVTFALPAPVSLTEGRKLAPKIMATMRKDIPEVVELLSQVGRPEDGTDPTLPSNLEVFVKLKPMDEWRPGLHTLDDIVEQMTTNLKAIPGLEYNFSQPIRDNVAENISGQFGQVALKIYGDDIEELQRLAEAMQAEIAKVPGVADLGIVRASQQPSIAVTPRREAVTRWNLDVGSVQDLLETALSGHTASQLWEGQRHFDVTVRLPVAARQSVESIGNLRVPLADGSLVPVRALADVTMGASRAVVTRENGKRYVGVRMNVRNRDLGSFIAEAQERVASAVNLPVGYDVLWGGEFENQERAMKRLSLVLPLSLLLVFLLLFAAFGTVWDATIILLNLPVALIGGFVGLGIAGMTLSVSAAVGFIALLGQAVLNGVLVVSAIRARLDRGEDPWTATIEGARERLRAVLMTALLASLGLLPAALSHAIGSETQRPIAVVVVGGTISSALLTLVVLPVTYYWAGWLRRRLRGGGDGPPAGVPRATLS